MWMKRVIDLTISFTALVLLAPIMYIVAVIIYVNMGRPIFFTQVRPGLHGEPFRLIKFRTMSNVVDDEGNLLSDELRLGRVGSSLRSTSLDELPELYNVLIGEMSIVGPRPLLMEYVPLYNSRHVRRMEVRPGLKGLAQVYGRNQLDWPDRFDLDIEYIDNRSLWIDFKIMFKTLQVVWQREGISQCGHTTAL
tara:strand:- start:585 stop:1163 length:579 start_codon:yes stop_codon:yes gene_type:complete